MKTKAFLKSLLPALLCLCSVIPGWAQDRSYELLPYPDLWYNDVDGIRVGAKVIGQVPGTFEDGPHRLKAGFWVGTWFPELPVSYYTEFTEPIPSVSGFNSEGNIQARSSIRTGVSKHSLQFNKRWQVGFDEYHFTTASIGITAQKRFDEEYLQYQNMWQQDWLWLGTGEFQFQNKNSLGRYRLKSNITVNLFGDAPSFVQSATEIKQRSLLGNGFAVRGRLFVGLTSDNTVPEFLFARSFRQPSQWIENGFSRAKGTIPAPWMASGIFQVAGGANLRGYTDQDITALENGQLPLLASVGSINIELDYPNPLDKAIKKIPMLGNMLQLRSYLFSDTGQSLGLSAAEETELLSDAGLGFMFSLNIPDHLGNPRGLMLRYDIPLWLSHPGEDQHVMYRSVIGIGAIFTF